MKTALYRNEMNLTHSGRETFGRLSVSSFEARELTNTNYFLDPTLHIIILHKYYKFR